MSLPLQDPELTRRRIRATFPALTGPDVFLDNAGGSQVPLVVGDRIRDYLLSTYAQLGADYETSRRSTATVARAHEFVRTFMNGDEVGEVVLGPSTSALCAMLAEAYARSPKDGRDEIIVCEAGHEANIAPWVRLEDRGYKVHVWRIDPGSHDLRLDELDRLLGARTRIVAVHHVSNLLGRIEDVPAITRLAHEHGARVVVDGVAYAPHRAIDVAAWEVDWYVYSTYKVYGPHAAALFGTHEAFQELEAPNFYFIDRQDVSYAFELGGVCHEACAGLLGLRDWLRDMRAPGSEAGDERATIEGAYRLMEQLEQPLQERLLGYLREKAGVRLVGPARLDPTRVPTISFVHESRSSREIAEAANARGLGIRYGHFYAPRLALAVGLEPDDGVVRTSLVHYNEPEEVERLVEFFETVL